MSHHQLTYVLITPHAVRKGRTGGILARLLSQSGLELVGGRFFNPSEKLSEGLAATFSEQELTAHYLQNDLTQSEHRALVLLLQGPDAISKVSAIAGDDERMDGRGQTLRDTYGDHFIIEGGCEESCEDSCEEDCDESCDDESCDEECCDEEDCSAIFYFEPGVIAPHTKHQAEEGLALLAQFSETDGGILDASTEFPEGTALEKTLVLIKPDNFRFPNTRPGGVIDLLTQTGLALVGFKVHNMSVAQAKEFYGPVLEVLEAKLPDGRIHWESIIAFMSGARPSECAEEKHPLPGSERCVALIYQGEEAVSKIRKALGPTDPSKAPHGTIRKEFGQDIMVNGAHASDSTESFLREIKIINLEEDNFKALIKADLEAPKHTCCSH